MSHYIWSIILELMIKLKLNFLYTEPLSASNRLRELENQLETLEASKPSAPPALKFKVRFTTVIQYLLIIQYLYHYNVTLNR